MTVGAAARKKQEHNTSKLKFKRGNAKLGREIHTFSLPSGHTCPGACECLAKVNMDTGELTDGPQQKFRCFSASQERSFKTVRLLRRYNFQLLRQAKTPREIRDLILLSLPTEATHIRVHVAGDFYSQAYFDAWMQVAQARPKVRMYAYTKSVHFWSSWLARHGSLPSNFCMVASLGGKFDQLIRKGMVTAKVVLRPREAKALGLQVDHDDSHAQNPVKHFALLVHGGQRPGGEPALAMQEMRQEGVKFGYSRT